MKINNVGTTKSFIQGKQELSGICFYNFRQLDK